MGVEGLCTSSMAGGSCSPASGDIVCEGRPLAHIPRQAKVRYFHLAVPHQQVLCRRQIISACHTLHAPTS